MTVDEELTYVKVLLRRQEEALFDRVQEYESCLNMCFKSFIFFYIFILNKKEFCAAS